MDKIFCKIRKKEVKKTPEEIVRQDFIEDLVELYNYEIENMDVEFPVKISPSDVKKSDSVDIVIFENNNPKIFIETKKGDKKLTNNERGQLKNYMGYDEHVKWGVLTNGSEKVYIEKIYGDKITFNECYNIPVKGFYEISEQIKIEDLKKNINLKRIFKNIRSYVVANDIGTTDDKTIVGEIIKLVLCKTYDEKFTDIDDFLSFHVYNKDKDLTFKKISEIYEKVKSKYDEVFDENDKIKLDKNSVFYIVHHLQNIYLTSSERNVLSDAFETIIGNSLKGSQGQFFTPKNVVKLIVHLVKPSEKDRILDPACGSGSFLIESMLYVWNNINKKNMNHLALEEERRDYAMKRIYGIEKDSFLARICKSYMAVIGDGKSGIVVDDSLAYPDKWESNNINLNSFDMVLTNPPFGKNIKIDEEIAKQFMSKQVDIAFLERSLDLLSDGGKIAIVLSETIFHASSYKKFREEFFYKNNILSIIDLPHDTFRPYNNAKCIVIILEKNKPQKDIIQMIKIDEIGHNHLGETKYVFDFENHKYTDILNDDIPKIINDLINENESNFIKYVDSKKVIGEDILVPRYYFDDKMSINYDYKLISELIDEGVIETFDGHGSPKSIYKGTGEIPYVRVKDIVNNEIYINHLDKIPEDVANSMKYNSSGDLKKPIYEEDIVFVWRGSYRIGDVGQIHEKDINSVYTKELQFFRVKTGNKYGLSNHNLFLLFKSNFVKNQFNHLIFFDTTLPTIYDRWNKIKIPLFSLEKMNELDEKGNDLFNLRKKYWKQFENINSF